MMRADQEKFCETVATPNFPAYAIEAVSGRYVIVGGGGGAARTGVRNKFDVYELYHNGKQTTAERVVSHDVGSACVSNMIGWCEANTSSKCKFTPIIKLALGQDEKCILLQLLPKLDCALPIDDVSLEEDIFEEDTDDSSGVEGLRHRGYEKPDYNKIKEMMSKKRKQERLRRESINCTLRGDKYFTFDVESVAKVDTVFNSSNKKLEYLDDVYQKVVRVSPDCKTLATGGTDGFVRLWSASDLSPLKEFKAHEKEVDDLDFSPDGNKIVSICKPSRECCVWTVKDCKKFSQLALQTNGVKYKFYRARYSTVESSSSKSRLFTISNVVVGSKHPGIIAKWNTTTYDQEKDTSLHGTLSCLALSDNGRYIATGTMDGCVYILIAFSLQLLRKVDDAHNVFVTSLSWLPTECKISKMVRGFSDASVLSISCDNTLKIHHIPTHKMIPVWVVSIFAVIVLFCAFIFANYIGL